MSQVFSDDIIRKIAAVLGVEARHYGNHYRFEVLGHEPERRVSFELYPSIPIGDVEGALATVYTPNSNLQLQHCTGVVASELLGEVTVFAEADGKTSGIIIEREGACSFYANVDRTLLSGDFTRLGPEVMLSGIALSLTEADLEEEGDASAAAPEER
jgi:hypothetical protein